MLTDYYAERRPWGIDVFGIITCDVCSRVRGASTSALHSHTHAEVSLICCGNVTSHNVGITSALERGERRPHERPIIIEATR